MERFRLRIRQQAKRGQLIELHLFPNMPGRTPREADARIMGSSASSETVLWLLQVSDPFLRQAEDPGPIQADEFRPGVPPHWLQHADGMRLALAFVSARYLTKPAIREMFRQGLQELPAEVVLYWFTLCFYGYRQLAGRAAFRTLLTYEQPESRELKRPERGRKGKKQSNPAQGDLFAMHTNGEVGNGEEKTIGNGRQRKSTNATR